MKNKSVLGIALFVTAIAAIYFFQSISYRSSEMEKNREFESKESEKQRQFEITEQEKQLKHLSEQNELDRQLAREKAAAEQGGKSKPQ